MNPVNPFIWWPAISETPEQFHEKNDWKAENYVPSDNKNELYWEFDPSWVEKKPKKQEKISKKDFEKFSEHPSFPVLERLWKSIKEKTWSALSIEDFTKIYEYSKWRKSSWNILEDIINTIKKIKLDITEDGIDIKNLMLEELSELKIKNENSGYWKEEIKSEKKWKTKLPEVFSQYESLKDENSLTVELLAANYLDFHTSANWKKNTEKDLETAFNITVNKIIDTKNFPRTESFEIALKDVRDWDIETKFHALQYINSFVQIKEWWKWKKSSYSFHKIRNEHIQNKEVYINFKIEQIEKLLKNTSKVAEKQQLIEKLEKYNKEKSVDDLEWEVFESWEMDNLSEKEWPISEKK